MQFPSLLELAMYMWLLVVCRTSYYWLGTPPRVTLMVLVEFEVWPVSLSWGTRCVPRGSQGLILGSTGRGRPRLYPVSVLPTELIDDEVNPDHIVILNKQLEIFVMTLMSSAL